MEEKYVIFWFRRDLRLNDNKGLYHALNSGFKVIPLYIFDDLYFSKFSISNLKVDFINHYLSEINKSLKIYNTELIIKKGNIIDVFDQLFQQYRINAIYANHDYEPYSIKTDSEISKYFINKGVEYNTYKDHVIFEKNEITKADGKPYSVFTPYKNNWLKSFKKEFLFKYDSENFLHNFLTIKANQNDLIIENSKNNFPDKSISIELIKNYHKTRDYPAIPTSLIGVHLRYGTVSIRDMVEIALKYNETLLNELIWREFFMQILFHYPFVENRSFKKNYDNIKWRNNEKEFELWCKGETGYSIVDAGMRELNETGFMHNRVRMITASFLCKHLLIDWRWGEAYFAEKLLDYELSANNGNWQWSSGSGCDSVPYFRIFNPYNQILKFDPNYEYIKKWVPEYNSINYKPIVEHNFARERCLKAYKEILNENIT
jgi:deoxyribodipyrimidine photo-lyase